jgi:hypothetical protein
MRVTLRDGFPTEPFDLSFQVQSAELEIANRHVIGRLTNQNLIDLIFKPFKVGNMGVGIRWHKCVVVAWLIDLQLEQNIGIRAEARSERRRPRRTVEPLAAVLFGRASFAAVKRSGVAQAQFRHRAAARLDTEALHHFNNMGGLTLAQGRDIHHSPSFHFRSPPVNSLYNSLHYALIQVKSASQSSRVFDFFHKLNRQFQDYALGARRRFQPFGLRTTSTEHLA